MNNQESPTSVSFVIYYRGVSMTITHRDSSIPLQPLVEEELKRIDWFLDNKKALPSWNSETNKALTEPEQKKTIHVEPSQTNQSTDWLEKPVAEDTRMCPIHNKEMKAKNGQYGVFYSHWLGKDQSGKSMYCNGKQK